MTKPIRYAVCVFLLFWLALFADASRVIAQEGEAGQAGEFLRWGVGGKALGLGRAFTSISDDASAMYWNPAGLASLSKVGGTVMFMHLPLREGASVNYLGGAIPLRLFFTKHQGTNAFVNTLQDLKLGVGVIWHSLGEFEFYDASARRVADASDNSVAESAVYFSASYPLNPLVRRLTSGGSFDWANFLSGSLDVGLTGKLVKQDLFGLGGSATTFDIGFKYAHSSGLFNAGFVLRDFNGSHFSYDRNLIGDKIPANGILGVSLTPPFGRLHGLMLSFDYGVVTPGEREPGVMFGAEYDLSYLDANIPVKIRIGTNKSHESLTFGVHFSPEGLLNEDWVPSGDWTYANDRGSFDAIGARFSFSVDRNPFTARYWYLNATSSFKQPECHDLEDVEKGYPVLRYLKNAQEAKNPGKRAYRYEAALRRADLAFLKALADLQNSKQTDPMALQQSARKFRNVASLFDNDARHYMVMDYGKSNLDMQDYYRSFTFYVQSLVLAGEYHRGVDVSRNAGRTWGRRIDLIQKLADSSLPASEYLNYLYAFALYSDGDVDAATTVIRERLQHSTIAKFLLGHILFLEGNYRDALASLDDIDLNDSRFPGSLFLPITNDCTFGDEVLFLRAASTYRLSGRDASEKFINEFAKIPRFFPNSDLALFLTNGNRILQRLIKAHEEKQHEIVHELVLRLINSYIKTFSNGTLIEEFYTFNYR